MTSIDPDNPPESQDRAGAHEPAPLPSRAEVIWVAARARMEWLQARRHDAGPSDGLVDCIADTLHRLGLIAWSSDHGGPARTADVVRGAAEMPSTRRKPAPEVVVLCGSTRFKDAWHEQSKRLTHEGRIVLSVGDLDTSDAARDVNVPIAPDLKVRLDELHKRKIDLADRVLVLNVGGYIGDSTRSEIEYAARIGRPITYLEPSS
ncbi:MAG: hypothetical protein ACRCZP_07620 [Phycicoccus sp.]